MGRSARWCCEHMQALLTNTLQRHLGDRRDDWVPGFFRYSTASMASLDAKTAFDVAKPLSQHPHGDHHQA